MSFLPFVLSFLLILVLGSSLLFNSFRSTSLEKTVILAQNRAKLGLISKQAEADYKASQARKPGEKPNESPNVSQEPKEKKDKIPVYKDKRDKRYGLESSKFNLWPLCHHSKSDIEYNALSKSAIRLIQILYQDADFYKKAKDPKLAEKILLEMISQQGEELSQLFPKTVSSDIYYKMLKGSNTGYPPLGEYFKIEKSKDPPIQWSYATTPILRAVLGDAATNRVLAAEKAAWEANHRTRIMPKEILRELLLKHTNTDFDVGQLETIFGFKKQLKGSPHTYVEKQNKVMSTR
jgi:hypothetical protein